MTSADANLPVRLAFEPIVRGLLSALWGVKTAGLDRVPPSGPLIVACNHASLADPPLLYAALAPARRPFVLAKKELFTPLTGWFFRGGGCIPVDRKGDATAAMKAALEVLGRGGSLSVFPEGTRVKRGERRRPKAGIAFLAGRSRAPVLPARVLGTDNFPWTAPLEVRFGAPMAPPSREEPGQAYAEAVMDAVYAL